MENKLEVIQSLINSKTFRINHLKESIKQEQRDIEQFIEQERYFWVSASAKKLTEYCTELENLSKNQREMQELLDFIKSNTQQEGGVNMNNIEKLTLEAISELRTLNEKLDNDSYPNENEHIINTNENVIEKLEKVYESIEQ